MSTKKTVADGLSRLLANTYFLYLKTHGFHWNVTGMHFNSLHTMFEGQYTELATAIDEIAERIRTTGEYAPGSFAEFQKIATLKETTGVPDAIDMVKILADDHATIIKTAKDVLASFDETVDPGTADFLIGRIEIHEKTHWMLTAMTK